MSQRSASYPFYLIEDSLEFSEKIYKNYGTNYRATREEIAEALGFSVGSLTQKISAAVQYDILDLKSKEGYQVTELFVKWYRPISEAAKKEALMEFFKGPTLYSDLISVFGNHILPPVKPLANILLQKHNISDKACDRAAEIFEENAMKLGLLSETRVLSLSFEDNDVNEVEEVVPVVDEIQNKPEVLNKRSDYEVEETNVYEHSPQVNRTGSIPHNIPLKNKMPAQLLLPNDISAADFDFIISYIGLIRNQY